MNSTLKIGPMKVLRIANDIMLEDNGEAWVVHPPRPFIGIIVEEHHCNAPGTVAPPPTISTLAVLKPHEARALASVLLAAATEAKAP